ncbi:hypothetical protein XELAEV_18014036mg [Xenopus laevis]|uniref:Synaptotagmin-like protein 2 n=1 Tax=Xenopus laevis TaxID=8355 RepID=A0A974DQK2_XENLA|nr:hypothetical protein XELAEV_18014036mg [Xenopus laevis]
MIDLSFLTEAEQEAILRVLNRDAELKKAEEERVRNLYDVVDDDQELKYKSGQWFYEAKSKRHRDKIHGADLVRASMRKRKAPSATLAELSRNYKENSSKKSWASSVNKDVFIPPELYGVMEDPEEEKSGFVPVKIEPTQSSKRVSFLSTDKNMESPKNGNVSPSRQRRNPFNSTNEGEEDTELGKDTQYQVPVNGTESGDQESYPDVLPSRVKFGVKLPYPAPGETVRLSSSSPNSSLTNGGQVPIPKPRTIPLKKTDSLERSASDLKREDSSGSTGKPKSILKRRSSSSSTDSESIRMTQKADINKMSLSTPILQVGKNNISAEPVDESPENSLDRLKQVRFSANVHQNPPSPGPEAVHGKEIGEFGILDPGLSQAQLVNPVHASSEDSVSVQSPSSGLVLDILTKTIYRKSSVEIPGLNGSSEEGPSLSANSASLNNITEDSFVQETQPKVSLPLEANVSSDNDPHYAVVKKPTESLSSGLSQDFDMEDAHKEPRFLGQGWKTQNSDGGGQNLVFGTSSGGSGKINFETNNLSDIPQLENVSSSEGTLNEENEGAFLDAEDNVIPDMESEPTDEPIDYFPAWRRPSIITKETLRQPITDNLRKEQTDAQQAGLKFRQPSQDSAIQSDSAYSSEDLKGESRYTPFSSRNVQRVEEKPDEPTTNLFSESKPYAIQSNTDKANVRFLDPNLEVTSLPIPSKFETMYFRERLSDGPKEQMLNQEQKVLRNTAVQNNLIHDTDVPSSTLLKDAVYSKKPLHVDNLFRSSSEVTPNTLLPQNNYEILSEEELTSQKVASWLAQTPSIHGEEQIDLNEEQMYPGEGQMYPTEEQVYAKEEPESPNEVVEESVERSMVNQKSGAEEFKIALQKLKEEMLQVPHITKMENSPDKGNVKAPEPFHYAVDKDLEREPTAYKSLPNSSFFQRVMQISDSINETASASPDERQMIKKQTSQSSETNNQTNLDLKEEEVIHDLSPLPVRAEMDYATPYDKHYIEEINSSNSEVHEGEVVQEKVAAVKDAFKISLEKLEEEYNAALANEAQMIPSSEEGGEEGQVQESPSPAIEQSEEEVVPEKVPVVKDAFKVAMERLAEEYESAKASDAQIIPSSKTVDEGCSLNESPSPTIDQSKVYANEVQEVVEKFTVPAKSGQDEFTAALHKLQTEASEPAYTTEPTNINYIHFNTEIPRDHENKPDEVQTNVYSPVTQSRPYETVENKDSLNVRFTSPDKGRVELPHSANFKVMTLKERISDGNQEKISNPAQFQSLRKFWNTEDKSPEELNANSKRDSRLNTKDNFRAENEGSLSDSSSTKTGSTLNDLQQKDENAFKNMLSKEPSVSVDGASAVVEKDITENKDKKDHHLLKLLSEEAASMDINQHTEEEEEIGAREWNWEDLEGQEADNPKYISDMPSRDVVISKKVYSDIESLPSYKNKEKKNMEPLNEPQEQGSIIERKPQDLYFAARYEVLDKNSGSDQSGSIKGNSGNLLNKKPEIESPDVSKPNSIEPKQGKPIGSPGNPDPLNPDKHAIEIMKAQDESITKVLDWLSKSSESGDREPTLLESKPVNNEKLVPIHKCEEEVDRTRGEGNVELTTLGNLEDFQQVEDCIQNSTEGTTKPLVFGISKGGIGKIQNLVNFAEYLESPQKEEAMSPASLSSPVQKETFYIDDKAVQQTLVPENFKPILIQGQASADEQSQFLDKNSTGKLENFEPLSPIYSGLQETFKDFRVSSSKVAEPLLFGYSKGGIGKMQCPVVNELGEIGNIQNVENTDSTNIENQVTSIVAEQTKNKIPENVLTKGSGPILQEQLVSENMSEPSSYQSETDNNSHKPGPKINDFWTQVSAKYVPETIKAVHIYRQNSNEATGESLHLGEGKKKPSIEFGEKKVEELPQDAEDTGNQVDDITLANSQGESVQDSGSKISNFDHKSINEVKLFWEKEEKETNGQSEIKRPVLKDVEVLGSQIHVKESIAAFSQKSSSFENDEGNSGLVPFKKVILDEEPLPSIDQLKTFWEQERKKLENLESKPRNEAIESETGQSEIKTTFATPPLNFDKMEKRKKCRKRHTFHCFFESDLDSAPKQDHLARGLSLNDGANGIDKKYSSEAFQSLRSFWDAGKNTQEDHNMHPPIGTNLEPPNIQVAPSNDLQNGPDSMAFQDKSGQVSNLPDEQSSLPCQMDSNKTVSILNQSQAEIGMEYPNIQTNYSHEPVSETIVKTVAPSKVEFLFNERLQKLQTEIAEGNLEVHPTCDSIPQESITSDHFPQDAKIIEMRNPDTEIQKRSENLVQDRFKNSPLNVFEESDNMSNMPTSEIFTSTKEQIEEGIKSPTGLPNSEYSETMHGTNTQMFIPNNKTGYEEDSTTILETDTANNTSLKEDTSYQTECSAPASEESAYATQEEFLSSSERVPPEGKSFDNELENSSNDLEKFNEKDPPQEVYEDVEQTFLKRSHDLKTSLEKLARESLSPAEGQLFPSSDKETVSSVSSQPLVPLNFKDSVQGNLSMPEKQSKKEIIEKIENPVIRSRPAYTNFDAGLAKLYRESLDLDTSALDASAENPDKVENNVQIPNEFFHTSLSAQNAPFINDPELHDSDQATPEESISSDSMYSDALAEVVDSVKRTTIQSRAWFENDLQTSQEVASDAEDLIGGSHSKPFIQTASITLRLNRYNKNMNVQEVYADSSTKGEPEFSESQEKASTAGDDHREVHADDDTVDQVVKQSTPVKERNSLLRRSTLQLYLEAPYRRDLSKSIDFELTGNLSNEADHPKYQDNGIIPKEDKDPMYEEVRVDEHVPERSNFSDPEKLKRLSQSVPSFLNDDTDGRETDSASENSFQLGRHKKSPSSLTNLSGSSGMASLSSVSGSVMSIYSGDFGNVDIKGNIQVALDYADNLQEFQVFVSQCKDLAAADVKKQRSDPYVKSYLLPEKAKMGKRKTGVKKKTLNPVYNDVLRYKITKNALLSQTLNLSVWHYDVLGRNSFLGEVDVNLASWDWSNKQMNWYPLQPRTPAAGIGLENRGEMKLALKYVPEAFSGAKNAGTGEVHIWLKECSNLPMLRGNKINSFIKCTILPDTSRKSRQKTRAVDKTPNPYFNHTMVYDGFRKEDLHEACVELTVWDHNKLTNHFLGGLRIGFGTGKSYGTAVDWMDSNAAEATTWEKMISSSDTWVEAILPLRMFKMAKMAK